MPAQHRQPVVGLAEADKCRVGVVGVVAVRGDRYLLRLAPRRQVVDDVVELGGVGRAEPGTRLVAAWPPAHRRVHLDPDEPVIQYGLLHDPQRWLDVVSPTSTQLAQWIEADEWVDLRLAATGQQALHAGPAELLEQHDLF